MARVVINGLRAAAAGLLSLIAVPFDDPRAQTYPDRAIKLIVPFPPGGVNDTVARPLADKLKDVLGQQVVIENRGGAGGTVGATAAARAEPDGYTLLFGSGATHIVGPAISPTKSYDPQIDFRSVAILTESGLAIAVHPSLGVDSLRDLIKYAREYPSKLSYASAGVGSATHLGAELFKSLIGDPSIAHVPYRGGAPATNDLIGGQVKLAVLNVSGSVLALHEAGKLKILAVTTPERVGAAPHIPTAIEEGVAGLVATNFNGLFVPTGTTDEIVRRLAEAASTAMSDPALLKLIKSAGLQLAKQTTPQEAEKYVRDEIARWTPIIKEIGLTAPEK